MVCWQVLSLRTIPGSLRSSLLMSTRLPTSMAHGVIPLLHASAATNLTGSWFALRHSRAILSVNHYRAAKKGKQAAKPGDSYASVTIHPLLASD